MWSAGCGLCILRRVWALASAVVLLLHFCYFLALHFLHDALQYTLHSTRDYRRRFAFYAAIVCATAQPQPHESQEKSSWRQRATDIQINNAQCIPVSLTCNLANEYGSGRKPKKKTPREFMDCCSRDKNEGTKNFRRKVSFSFLVVIWKDAAQARDANRK